MSSTGSDGVLTAYQFQEGRHERLDALPDFSRPTEGFGFAWVHLDRQDPSARAWLRKKAGLPSLLCDALLAEETRPRCEITRNGLLLILRGVNMNAGADPDDMVSLRLWSDGRRLISLRMQRVLAVADVEEHLRNDGNFTDAGELISFLATRLTDRVSPVVDSLEEHLDTIEEEMLERGGADLRIGLSGIRRQAVSLRRYLAPQREVITRLSLETVPWFPDPVRSQFRELADRVTRHVEDLDEIRERAAVTQEELLARSQERLNRNTYILSIVAAVFLPLGFLTGLLGINVGGIPGTDSPSAFLIVCGALLLVGAVELLFFYWRRWF